MEEMCKTFVSKKGWWHGYFLIWGPQLALISMKTGNKQAMESTPVTKLEVQLIRT